MQLFVAVAAVAYERSVAYDCEPEKSQWHNLFAAGIKQGIDLHFENGFKSIMRSFVDSFAFVPISSDWYFRVES